MNEQDIIAAVRGGNTDRYELLVKRYHVGLIIHCDHLVKDRDAAEDIAQEAFIKAFQNLEAFDASKSRFSTWLYRIATNKALDYLRAAKKTVPDVDIDSFADDAAPDYDAEQTKRAVRQAVAALRPPSHREVIEAFYWRGESYQDIATAMGIPINTVRTWLRRAKQQLRSTLS